MKGRVPDIRDTREPLVAPLVLLSLLKAGKADRLRRKSKALNINRA